MPRKKIASTNGPANKLKFNPDEKAAFDASVAAVRGLCDVSKKLLAEAAAKG